MCKLWRATSVFKMRASRQGSEGMSIFEVSGGTMRTRVKSAAMQHHWQIVYKENENGGMV